MCSRPRFQYFSCIGHSLSPLVFFQTFGLSFWEGISPNIMDGCSSTLHEFLPGKMATEENGITLKLLAYRPKYTPTVSFLFMKMGNDSPRRAVWRCRQHGLSNKKYVEPWDEDDRYLRERMGESDKSVSSQLRDCQFEQKQQIQQTQLDLVDYCEGEQIDFKLNLVELPAEKCENPEKQAC